MKTAFIHWPADEKTSSAAPSAPQPIPAQHPRTAAFHRDFPGGGRQPHCPHCQSIIYSRRHRSCGICGQALPKELLFSPAESSHIEHLLKTEKERHRKWVKRTVLDALAIPFSSLIE